MYVKNIINKIEAIDWKIKKINSFSFFASFISWIKNLTEFNSNVAHMMSQVILLIHKIEALRRTIIGVTIKKLLRRFLYKWSMGSLAFLAYLIYLSLL